MRIRKTILILSLMIAAAITSSAVSAVGNPAVNDPVGKAEVLIHSFAAGDYTSVEANFNTQMQQALPAEKLKEAWNQITAQAGDYMKTDETKTTQYQGDTVILVKTLFKNGALWAQVAFDKSDKVAGLYFRPVN